MDKNKALIALIVIIPVASALGFFFFGLSWRYALFAASMVFPLVHFLAMQQGGCCGERKQTQSKNFGKSGAHEN